MNFTTPGVTATAPIQNIGSFSLNQLNFANSNYTLSNISGTGYPLYFGFFGQASNPTINLSTANTITFNSSNQLQIYSVPSLTVTVAAGA